MSRAVFLDRDGVINKDHGYVHLVDDFEYIDGVFESCLSLKEMGYKLVVVTNQSGIARGMYTEDQFHSLTEWMDWNFADKGVELDGIYYCPHHAEKGIGEYKVDCDCRKPKPGMLNDAAQFLKIDLANSVMVGDKAEDMQAAKAAGVTTRILVRSGKVIADDSDATVVLDSIADVPAYLKSLG
ncbi:MAG: D-glycero-beta-D-manno-heptose 1,7-bisphosphate 7-phosphatase [Shewanella sp.]|uniref:D-glycero-beta-D-manno-heptose 1,7-bisphosphate 7-phosphatase n=1 Tax=Shewanella TaxID=22 RepID=UPI0018E38FD6|nr:MULTISPECIES: D-glycero-beta-D-manno-heptose 1,7-bisphosphate 7-phosphatase [Shewanella]MBI1677035.1 D-glycero-beta-D-manno-heptose 1,7-bisphosphate 7-phosphatase [Shewanella sp. DW31]MCU8008318.1 D-glycero-beta-D-manno-heptose 1,7-bisphosphate 7-phosphatase [Shewanella sp. SM87]MCU8036249.1 D-glycero-beta-D-manno-heptose 1,7-bisphosphate 7-phosphatase [Shewanella sp. SM71]MCU8098205.1 D-glycero-beta-D-manno-heptose 1,7-bisphosphate 7-phosphatase [Shewanella sp. SM102]WVI94907.1 D-glycero-b